ncbi:hypothetical protein NSA47_14930 [Irregularibacter muris]|uniref:Uncharacterized protein n=1 Tax=Irregularibacter muris TaxID=1796619 RepID=A0AAE3L4L9_9FIRM|nr:hypothetical protein [Irregularibacter muris]MCR1900258.1 hypothetical protein [Irregularibacter muris]
MQDLIKGLLYFTGLAIVFALLRYRSKKFWFVKSEIIRDYPIVRYKTGSLIAFIWIVLLSFGIVQELFLETHMNIKMFLVPFATYVIYSFFGAVPTVTQSRYKIDLTLDWVNVGSIGFDWLGSWIGEYEDGVIVYFYLIDYDSIKVSKLSKEEIVFSGREKQEDIPISVTLKSKPSINYFYPLLECIKKDCV